MLKNTEYKQQYDKVAVHRNICKTHELPHFGKWYDHRVNEASEANKFRLFWDVNIEKDSDQTMQIRLVLSRLREKGVPDY